MNNNINLILKQDCRHFRGSRPCMPNKLNGVECQVCPNYSQVSTEILIIKLDAIGDVIRTLSILPPLRKKYSNSYIVWITRSESVEIVKACPYVDEVWEYGVDALLLLQSKQWTWVYNLSNDPISAGIATLARASDGHIGFVMGPLGLKPTNDHARRWLEMACFDRLKKLNEDSYQEIMYNIAGISATVARPEIILPVEAKQQAKDLIRKLFSRIQNGPLIGINTGAGNRWPKKVPDVKRWVQIIQAILSKWPKADVGLLGGPEERQKNAKIEAQVNSPCVRNTGCNHSLFQFAAIIDQLDVLICGDTLALHLASAMNIPSVALFGPTSSAEIYDYNGLIEKVVPDGLDCLCCYSDCTRKDNCMALIPPNKIIEKIKDKVDHQS